MSASFTLNASDLRLGPCRVSFGGNDLGGTMGGVKAKFDPKFVDLMVDQLGDVPVDSVLTGQKYSVEFELAAAASKDIWKIAMPYAKKVTGATSSIYVENAIGTQLRQFAQPLILHPLANNDADTTEDIKYFLAVVKSAFEVDYGPSKQRGIKVTLDILPDFSTSPARYLMFGDPANGAVAATAAAAVAGSNTGNGTCTSITPGASTSTETVTVTCIGINGSNHSAWKVEGSVSNAIGTVVLSGGVGGTGVFASSKVNFTLTDGTVDFIVGDTFTIATVAANYV